MNSPDKSSAFESRDAVLLEFDDTQWQSDTSRPRRDETLRRLLSKRFLGALTTEPARTDLEQLLVLAREREQFCRGANDSLGLARCLGNQALIQKAGGRIEEALALLQQLESLGRRLGDVEGLTFALIHQAAILEKVPDQAKLALPLAEQAHRLAAENQLTDLAQYIAPLVEHIRARIHTP